MNTILITDSCCDLPYDLVEKNNIKVIGMNVTVGETEFVDDLGKTLTYVDFYNKLKEGQMAKTAQINAYTFEEEFKKYVKEGKSIIYIAFSSALSGTYNSANLAREAILEEYKDADITIIDSKAAASGLGLLVYYANEMIKDGKPKEEVVSWVEDNKLKVVHWFTVEDLNHLHRGGRVSKTAATVGTLLNVKPVMNVDNDGKLVAVEKARGRKKSISSIISKVEEQIENPTENIVFIGHGDCLSEAEDIKNILKEKLNVKEVIINYMGPTIGAHTGPGVLGVFFLGRER